MASEAESAFFTSMYSCIVMGLSDRSESRLCGGGGGKSNGTKRKKERKTEALFTPDFQGDIITVSLRFDALCERYEVVMRVKVPTPVNNFSPPFTLCVCEVARQR